MPESSRCHPLWLFAGLALLVSTPAAVTPQLAHAQSGDQSTADDTQSDNAPSDKDMKAARQQFIDGRKDYQNGDFSHAADHFLKAYDLSNRTELLFNIAKAYRKAGRLVDAEHYFRKYLRRMPEAQNADEVGTQLVEINRALAKQKSSLQINSDQSGRLVFIGDDQSPRCLTPCDLTLEPGDYNVRLDADGFQSSSTSISLKQGASRRVSMSLKSAPTTGQLSISTTISGGMLTVDGSDEYGLPLDQPIALESGTHDLAIKGPDGGSWSQTVDITSGERATLFVPGSALQTPDSPKRGGSSAKQVAGVGLLSASAALIAGGLILGSQAQQTHDALSSQQQTRGVVDPDFVSRGRSQMNAANILLGAGAGAFLGGSGLITWDLLSN